jgi:hypothetical protein
MPVPSPVPFNVQELSGNVASVANAQTTYTTMPFTGRIILAGVTTGAAATSTADATCTVSINGTAIPNSSFLVTNGTLAYTTTSAGISSGNVANQGDIISWAFTGTGAGGGTTTGVYVLAKRGS